MPLAGGVGTCYVLLLRSPPQTFDLFRAASRDGDGWGVACSICSTGGGGASGGGSAASCRGGGTAAQLYTGGGSDSHDASWRPQRSPHKELAHTV